MRPFSLVIAILVGLLSSGCVFGPSGECEITPELTESDCDHAIQAALEKLPNDRAATKLMARPGCPRYMHCLPSTIRLSITVEVTFKGIEGSGEILVVRNSWEAGELHMLPAPCHQVI